MHFRLTKRVVALTAIAVLCASAAASARTVAQVKQVARSDFEKAEQMRDSLAGLAPEQRTRKDYQRVIEAYRRVYHIAPTSSKADAAVNAVAELLAEAGRRFDDEHSLKAAIGQYEFLRREYPGSKYRVDALFAIAQIYNEDLNDREQAKASLEDFLKHYPKSHLAADARAALAELNPPPKPARKKHADSGEAEAKAENKTRDSIKESVADSRSARREATKSADALPQSDELSSDRTEPASLQEKRSTYGGSLPRVTGVRHWSTPEYTRVAIDVDAEVKYEAGRIGNPDRIYFDLHDTRLAAALLGKTFEVQDGLLRKVRVAENQRGITRVVLEVNGVADYSVFLLPNPYRLIIDIHGKKPAEPQTILATKQAARESSEPSPQTAKAADKPLKDQKKEADSAKRIAELEQKLKQQDSAANAEDATINVAKATRPELKATPAPTSKPTVETVAPREKSAKTKLRRSKDDDEEEVADITKPSTKKSKAKRDADAIREAKSLSTGERSLIRALGLKIGKIVIDAGHGGHDTGTVGPRGLQEKDLVLDVALRLGKLLQNKLGADVVYTRDDDTFIPLETRTAIANQQQADLFISIHANSSHDPSARGVETYYLNFTQSPEALEVAARENSVSEKSIHELQDLVKKITLKEKIDESREFAADIQKSLYTGLSAKSPSLKNRGVKKAPFIVLIGANMPSILAEISFVSNPADERRLETSAYREKIADSLYRGVANYVSGLAGVKVASTRAAAESAR